MSREEGAMLEVVTREYAKGGLRSLCGGVR